MTHESTTLPNGQPRQTCLVTVELEHEPSSCLTWWPELVTWVRVLRVFMVRVRPLSVVRLTHAERLNAL